MGPCPLWIELSRDLLDSSILTIGGSLKKEGIHSLYSYFSFNISQQKKTYAGCGNTLPDMVPSYSGQVRNLYLLVLGQI